MSHRLSTGQVCTWGERLLAHASFVRSVVCSPREPGLRLYPSGTPQLPRLGSTFSVSSARACSATALSTFRFSLQRFTSSLEPSSFGSTQHLRGRRDSQRVTVKLLPVEC